MFHGNKSTRPGDFSRRYDLPPIVSWRPVFVAILFFAAFALLIGTSVQAAIALSTGLVVIDLVLQLMLCSIVTGVAFVLMVNELRRTAP